MDIKSLAKEKILLLDGAMGTAIQSLNLGPEAFDGHAGCNEYLVLTIPEKILDIHKSYFAAGSDIVETNTFGATPLVLGEYNLADKTEEINKRAAELVRKAAEEYSTSEAPRFAAGSMGPGTKLPSLGQIPFDELCNGYKRQATGLLEGGVDILMIETCQDLLQTKAALCAVREVMARLREVPIYVSITIEQTGTLLTGTDMTGVITILSPFEIDILGMNCATGPVAMRPNLEILSQHWKGLKGVYPNAGLPMATAKGVIYPEGPEEFSKTLGKFVRELPINVVGGCCGTTPEHIRAIAKEIKGLRPLDKHVEETPAIASLFSSVEIKQDIPPLYIGERSNATGGKAFRKALLSGDTDDAFDILNGQEESGSHAVDLSVAYTGLDEVREMSVLVARAAKESMLPLSIDSTSPEVVEAALKLYAGRAIINSINLEDGGKRAETVCLLAKKFGAALICLTIDEEGMALDIGKKVSVAKRLVDICVNTYGLQPSDLFLDPLTFTIGSGDPSLKTAAADTLESVKRIKAEIPGVHILLGISNVSFGLERKSRKVLNSVFLNLAVNAGLDAAILNPRHIIPLAGLEEEDKRRALDLIVNRSRDGADPLEAFINHFSGRDISTEPVDEERLDPWEALRLGIIKGALKLISENIPRVLKETAAENILNNVLIPAMKEVGDLFGAGQLQLPFVLKSAETMKKSVDMLRPHFSSGDAGRAKKKLLIATVRGDVHDVGKNLVKIIVGNNGFDIVDLGTRVPVDVIINEAVKEKADAIGMSGLLVSSAMIMAENLRAMTDAGFDTPVLVGGAALTHEFTSNTLKPAYTNGPVAYCKDAFEGLVSMQNIAQGKPVDDKPVPVKSQMPAGSIEQQPISIKQIVPPKPPFTGGRVVKSIPLDVIYNLVNEEAPFRGKWGYRRGKMESIEYAELIQNEVRPKYIEMQRIIKAERLFKPGMVYGWFRGRGKDDRIIIEHDGAEVEFHFPRRTREPKIAIPDFVKKEGDTIGFFVVTLGSEVEKRGRMILEKSGYLDYYLLHGLAMEATDALAEYCHQIMRHELGIQSEKRRDFQDRVSQKYRGSRYAFGYPACPDLSLNEKLFQLLKPGRIKVELSETFQMIPEFSTSAIVIHHPQAKYFSV